MTRRRLKAFTLIELLVVIAIIAILAAMLFPVFARARESARKIQCLSNVKNLAMAVQIYLSDYDRFPPAEHRPEVAAWMEANGHSLDYGMNNANPYLRWDVVFDEYVKNRDIYRCPSAKVASTVEHIVPVPDWFAWVVSTGGNCDAQGNYPLGWGGTQTDGGCQNWAGPNTGAVELDIAFSEELLREKKPSSFDDPAKTLVVAERFSERPGMVVDRADRLSGALPHGLEPCDQAVRLQDVRHRMGRLHVLGRRRRQVLD